MGLFNKPTQSEEPRQARSAQKPEPNKVFSYHAARNLSEYGERNRLRPEMAVDVRSRKKNVFAARIPFVLAVLVLLGCVGYNLLLSTEPRIIMAGSDESAVLLRDQEAYETVATKVLEASPLNRSKVTFQTGDVSRELNDAFPELSRIDVSLPLLGQRPLVYIEPAEPVLVLVAQDGTSYALDLQGRIISTDVRRVPDSVPYVNDQAGLELRLGSQALPSNSVAYILEILHQLKARNIATESIALPAGVHELQLWPNGADYYVRLSLREDARQQVGTYIALREYLQDNDIKPSRYVDVRVGERVYYR